MLRITQIRPTAEPPCFFGTLPGCFTVGVPESSETPTGVENCSIDLLRGEIINLFCRMN